MTRTVGRRSVVVVGALATLLVITGCAAGQVSQTANEVAAIDGANASAGRIAIRDVTFPSAPGETGYAAGVDVPLLLTISNDSIDADTLTQVSTAAAGQVQIDGKAVVPAQSFLQIGTESKVRLTLKALSGALLYGRSVPVTFTFTTAGPITVNVPIALPATRSSGRPTVDIQPANPTPLWLTGAAEH